MKPTFRYYQVDGGIVSCSSCGELRIEALRRKLIDGNVYCMNCASKRTEKQQCGICDTVAITEKHHIYKRKYKDTITICLNCHARISKLQMQYPQTAIDKLSAWVALFYTWLEVKAMQKIRLQGVCDYEL